MESQQRVIYVGLESRERSETAGVYGAVGNTAIDPYKTQGVLSKTVYSWDEANAADSAFQKSLIRTWVGEICHRGYGLDFGLF